MPQAEGVHFQRAPGPVVWFSAAECLSFHMIQKANPITLTLINLRRSRHHHLQPGRAVAPERSEHNPSTQPAAPAALLFTCGEAATTTLGPKGRCPLSASEHNLPPTGGHNPRAKGPSTLMCAFCIECASQPKLALSLPIKGSSYCRLTVRRACPKAWPL